MDKTEFESDLRRDGFRPVCVNLRPTTAMTSTPGCWCAARRLPSHATLSRRHSGQGSAVSEVSAGYMHTEQVGPEGVAYIVDKVARRVTTG